MGASHPRMAQVWRGARVLVLEALHADLRRVYKRAKKDTKAREGQIGGDASSLGGVPLDLARVVARDLSAALAHVHARGVAHLDVKPDNVVLDAARTRCVLVDFGSSRIFPSSSEARAASDEGDGGGADASAYVASRYYRAPEVCLGARPGAGPPADVWALGVTLAECATGRLLFTGRDNHALLKAVADRRGTRATQLARKRDSPRIDRRAARARPRLEIRPRERRSRVPNSATSSGRGPESATGPKAAPARAAQVAASLGPPPSSLVARSARAEKHFLLPGPRFRARPLGEAPLAETPEDVPRARPLATVLFRDDADDDRGRRGRRPRALDARASRDAAELLELLEATLHWDPERRADSARASQLPFARAPDAAPAS